MPDAWIAKPINTKSDYKQIKPWKSPTLFYNIHNVNMFLL